MLKTVIISAVAVVLAGSAGAQSRSYYGPNGQFLGSARTYGGTTTYQGPTGQHVGTAHTYGGTTTYYGPAGQYRGSSRRY